MKFSLLINEQNDKYHPCLQWKSERDNIETQGTRILEALTDAALVQAEGSTSVPDLRQCMQKCYLMLSKTYDEEKGGFGKAPKFPQPGIIKQGSTSLCEKKVLGL